MPQPKRPAAKKVAGRKPAAAKPGRRIDLNAARAARAELDREPVFIEIGDDVYELPAELPAEFALVSAEGDLRGAVFALLGQEDAERFFSHRPSFDDLQAMIEGVGASYGIEPGEAKASGRS